MDWTRPEAISAAALAVSTLSFAVSALTAWRSFKADRPRLWLVLEPTKAPDCWIGNIHVESGPRAGFVGHTVQVADISMKSARNQPILLGSYRKIIVDDEQGNAQLSGHYTSQCSALKLLVDQEATATVQKGEHGIMPIIVYRPAMSGAESVKLVVTLKSLASRPSYRSYTIQSEIPKDGIKLVLG
ncbi:MAG: hypothetical protein MIN69_13365 [Methylorubrum extorquens]|uniref:hypothetical protein n=1 Tax=Methylorubrum extorquens TaxID=408 RepID=UPI002FEE5A5F